MKNKEKKLSGLSVFMLLVSSAMLIVSVFVPLWRIDLDAPQYPEGLRLLIFPNKISGSVDIINGLNHYIGMKTLHTEDFIEFTVLPYIIGFFALFSLLSGIIASKKLFYTLFILFVAFGIVAMVDFWRWEYNYGHNLDPNAAIIVPGMAYQPPLIGFKQLLNFGAFSVPAAGGWLFIASGAAMLIVLLKETSVLKRKNKVLAGVTALLLFSLGACSGTEPEKIKLNYDNCDYCKMTIADARFVAQIVSPKGRVYKFDDAACMRNYLSENIKLEGAGLFVANFERPDEYLDVHSAVFAYGENIASPMGGNAAAFASEETAKPTVRKSGTTMKKWADLPN
jgi:copper chaperone NosL